jgi:hypothetical protein
MKNELINAINYMESINVDLEKFYAIRKTRTQTTFQGYYNQEIAKSLILQEFHSFICSDGFVEFNNKDASIRVVLS